MSEDKLTQEELLSSLTTWKALADIAVKLDGYYKDKEEQAYTQLKEIVKKEGLWEKSYITASNTAAKEIARQAGIITELRQQKPTVTKAWVDVQAADLMGAINDLAGKVGVLQILRESLPILLEDAGVGIE